MHEIRDLCWDGIPSRGASWLRELPHHDNATWRRTILIPTCGGLVVSLLNTFRSALDEGNSDSFIKAVLKPILKAVAAAFTLGTGNSLGPEGPSVEIGASVANGVGSFFEKDTQRKLSLKAAGSAAGIASGLLMHEVFLLNHNNVCCLYSRYFALRFQCCCCWVFFCCRVGIMGVIC